jgi:hypothetical protein
LSPITEGHEADLTLLASIIIELRWNLSHSGKPVESPTSEAVVLANVVGSLKAALEAFDDFDGSLELIVSPI